MVIGTAKSITFSAPMIASMEEAHLERAEWMTRTGYRMLLSGA
jgi:hypothetical protein